MCNHTLIRVTLITLLSKNKKDKVILVYESTGTISKHDSRKNRIFLF